MDPTRILFPMLALVGLTMFVLTLVGVRRVAAVRAGQVRPRDFALGESAAVPPPVALPNRNFMNLLEVPVLFYVVCLTFYATREVTLPALVLAWGYVGLRFAHSVVHLTSNRLPQRLALFGASNLVLLALWGYLLLRLVR